MKSFKLNPLAIFIGMLLGSVSMLIADWTVYALLLVVDLGLLALFSFKKGLKFTLFYLILWGWIYAFGIITKGGSSMFFGFLYTFAVFIVKFYPGFILMALMMTYSTSEIIASIRKMGLPENIAIVSAIFFRYLPEFRQQMKQLKMGAKTRGLTFCLKEPVQSIERFTVPMIYRSLSIADTVTASIITKGIKYPCKKTCYRYEEFGPGEYAYIIFSMTILGVSIWKMIRF